MLSIGHGCSKSIDSNTEFCCTLFMWPLVITYCFQFELVDWSFVIIHWCRFKTDAYLDRFIVDLGLDYSVRSVQLCVTYAFSLVTSCMHPPAYGNSIGLIVFLFMPSGLMGAQLVYSYLIFLTLKLFFSFLLLSCTIDIYISIPIIIDLAYTLALDLCFYYI